MIPPTRPGGDQPWLSIGMLLVTSVLLIATVVSDDAHTVARFTIVGLWWLTSIAALLKERFAYGMGDRVTLFGMALILAVSVSAALFDFQRSGRIGAMSVLSLVAAAVVLITVFRNVLARARASDPFR